MFIIIFLIDFFLFCVEKINTEKQVISDNSNKSPLFMCNSAILSFVCRLGYFCFLFLYDDTSYQKLNIETT